jgi:uncharacterized protein (DUF58 family)
MITVSGVVVAAVAVLLIAAGTALDYPELLAGGLAAAAALVLAGLWMLLTPDVEIRREIQPSRVGEGDEAHGLLVVANSSRRGCPPMTASETIGRDQVSVTLPALAPGARFEAAYPLPTARRGVFTVGPLTVGHSDPLRLMSNRHSFPSRSVLRVHPRIHPVVTIPTGGSPDTDGQTSATAAQGGVAFHSLRDYVRGDDLRLVHWRSTARTGRLMVRHNVVPREPRMLIVLDTSAGPYREDGFEEAVRVAASLAAAGQRRGFPVELATTGGERVLLESGRAGGPAPLLDLLAGIDVDPDDPGLRALPGLVPQLEGVALGVVTGQPGAEQLAVVSGVRPRFAMVSLIHVAGADVAPAAPARGIFVVTVPTSVDFARVWNSRLGRR